MLRDHLRRLLGHLKRARRMEQRLTVEEFYQLLRISEAIIQYGRMIKAYQESPVSNVIVEIPELASRFRETNQTIRDALQLLSGIDRAEPVHLPRCWILRLEGTLLSGREGVYSATRDTHCDDDNRDDLGAA